MSCSGPSSIILALIASGFNGQAFTFHGYLPIDKKDRTQKLRQLEQTALKTGISQIFMETPFRNEKLFEQIMEVCHGETHLCVRHYIGVGAYPNKSLKAWKQKYPHFKNDLVFLLLGCRSNWVSSEQSV